MGQSWFPLWIGSERLNIKQGEQHNIDFRKDEGSDENALQRRVKFSGRIVITFGVILLSVQAITDLPIFGRYVITILPSPKFFITDAILVVAQCKWTPVTRG